MSVYDWARIVIAVGFLVLLIGVKSDQAWVKPCLGFAFFCALTAQAMTFGFSHFHPWLEMHRPLWRQLSALACTLPGIAIGILITTLASGQMLFAKKK